MTLRIERRMRSYTRGEETNETHFHNVEAARTEQKEWFGDMERGFAPRNLSVGDMGVSHRM